MRKGKEKGKGKRQRKESLTKGMIGKFSFAQKPSRYEIARELEKRLNHPEGKGTNRSMGSEQTIRDKIEQLRSKR
jgi:hypothetical protein